ncbi:MAG: hypothetical protein AAF560_29370, partial [Acidobacteriota bacterium]
GAPVDQQISFLDKRISVLMDLLDSDPDSAGFRNEFVEKMGNASRYYKTIVRSIDIEQRFSSLG